MAYNNPISQAVLGNQQREIQNKQFEASLGLQIAQFAENKANTTKDQAYRQKVLGENTRATGVTEAAAAAKVVLEGQRYDALAGQRAATQANTEASAAYNSAQATKVQADNQNALLKDEGGLWWQHMMNPDGTDKALDTPETQEYFGAVINQPGISKLLLTGSDGTAYKFKGIVDAGNGRRAIQIMDPNNPDKVMYMSKDRTAVESDPLTSMDLMSFDILKSQVSIALHQASGRPLSADLQAAADGMNAIRKQPKNSPILLDSQTIQQSAELSEQMQVEQAAQQQPPEQQLGANRTDVGPYENGVPTETAVMDPSNHDLSTYSWDQLNSLTDSQWDKALESSEERLQTMLYKPVVFGNIDKLIKRNNKTMSSVQKQIDKVVGKVPDALQGQLQLLKNNDKRLTARKAAGNDTVDAAQKAHNDLLSAKEVADGKKPAPTAKVKAAANIVKQAKIDPRQSKDPDLAAAVEKKIIANPPPVAQVAQALNTPQEITPGLLYQLHTAKALGLIDQTSLQTALDLGVFSQSAVDLMKQQMIENGEIIQQAMKNEATAAKPTIKTNGAGQVVALDANGQEQWRTSIGDPRSTADQTAIIAQHSDQGDGGYDIEESIDLLGRQFTLSTKDTPMPELEQNLLAQNLQSYLVEELSLNGLTQFYDWARGSDEDDVHNPMEMVTTNFAYDKQSGEIWLFDENGERHADQDYTLDNLSSNAVKLVLPGILKSPEEVQLKIKIEKKRQIDEEIAKLTK